MTDPHTILRTAERETLTPEERAMFDAAVAAIPPEHNALFTALMFGSRGMVRHNGRELVIVAEGYRELLDASDEARRDLIDAAREFQAGVTSLRTEVAAGFARLDSEIITLRADVDAIAEATEIPIPSRAVPALRQQIVELDARMRLALTAALAVFVVVEFAQWLYIVWALARVTGGA